ncbi:MAG: aconitate hydratase AcnA, partial [Chlamydiae bacterium]|nr:aconitate hydratase AcnA [Chlamydiota bacterium]
MQDPFACLRPLFPDDDALHYSLPLFAKNIDVDLSKIPFSLRILLESLLRGYDGKRITQELILALVKKQSQKIEIPLLVSRILLQDFTGVPLLVDLAAMRDAAIQEGINPGLIEPIIPVDLVVDHSVQVDRSSKPDAFAFNLELEFQRNQERYAFLNWGQQAFKNFRVVPPGVGIVHQVNLEYLAHVVTKKNVQGHTLAFFDTLLGTDSHTTMIGGLGVLGWGVGGIEAEAAMLGQPYSFPLPDVIGVHLHHRLQEGVTATDLALSITELLRKEKVVGQFVEFFGEGASYLSVADRATISNMAPEYGATLALFPVDDKTLDYLRQTGRPHEHVEFVHSYLEAQGMFGMPQSGEILFSRTLDLDLSLISPSIAGPKRPQDRIPLSEARSVFRHHLASPLEEGGYGKTTPLRIVLPTHPQENTPHITGGKESLGLSAELPSFSESEMVTNRPFTEKLVDPGYAHLANHEMLEHGSLVIAAITSCTNTSNPSVMIAAGLLAKKAVEKGLTVPSTVKTSLAPGSRVVTDYLVKAGLQPYLDQLGFTTVAYGCTTCIGNSGPLDTRIEAAIQEHDLIVASALSGNRNFEARIHGAVKANFLMSPPLVIAFALAGTVAIDFTKEPLGHTNQGVPVFLRDLWPTQEEIEKLLHHALSPMMFQERYKEVFEGGALWEAMQSSEGTTYTWESASTYIQQPPFLSSFQRLPPPLPQLTNL